MGSKKREREVGSEKCDADGKERVREDKERGRDLNNKKFVLINLFSFLKPAY